MRRASVITFAVGLTVMILGMAKVVEGGLLLGMLLGFAGAVCFGLSFIRRPDARPDAPPALPLVSRVVEVFTGSTRVFTELHARPRWLAALLIIAASGFAYNVVFTIRVTPEVITAAGMNKAVEAGIISPERAAQVMEVQVASARSIVGRVSDGVGQFIAALFVMMVLAGLYWGGVRLFGGRINFWAALCVAIYASLPPVVINNLLSIFLLYVKSPDEIDPIRDQQGLLRDNLGVLFSPSSQPILYTAASFVGVLTLYRLWLTARGLRHAGERVSAEAAWAISLGLWGTGLLLGLAWVALFPSMA
ncbi:MAG TPA: YIP1 family protein [Pyrinomonadaceae bacterium]|nr:YIP1 family protein [Pyrinomonadaceae bacterium]